MNASLKAAWLLIALVGFALWCATPATAENEQVQFYNSPAATAAKLPFSQAVRVGDVLYMSGAIGILPGKRSSGRNHCRLEAGATLLLSPIQLCNRL